MVVIIIGVAHRPNLSDLQDSLFPFKMKTEFWTPTESVPRANFRNQGKWVRKRKEKAYEYNTSDWADYQEVRPESLRGHKGISLSD